MSSQARSGCRRALADGDAVEARLPDRRRVVGVGEDGPLGADRAVVGDHEHRIERGVEPLHHVQRLVPAGEIGGAVVQRTGTQVVHRAVRIVDQDVAGAGIDGSVDGGVDLVGEQLAADLVLGARGADLLPVDDPGGPLDVGRDEDPHVTGIR
jgi:hypothetical protein